jgi:hypothetical protein
MSKIVLSLIISGTLIIELTSHGNDCRGQVKHVETQKERIDHAIKQLEVVVSNSKSWRQGDVLWKHETHFDSFDTPKKVLDQQIVDANKLGGVVKSTSWNRFVFDYENDRYCWLSRVEIEQTNFETTARNRIQETAYIVDRLKKRAFNRVFPNPRSVMDFSRLDSLPVGFPDLRDIGLGDRPTSNSFHLGQQWLKELRHAAQDAQLSQNGERILVVFEHPAQTIQDFDNGGELTAVNFDERSFDAHSLMPIHFRMWGKVKNRADMGGPRSTFQWTENEGIYLPKSVQSTQFAQRPIYGTPQFGWEDSRIDFHWFSINKPIDEGVYDGSILDSGESFHRMIDPHESRATYLIECEEKKKPKIELKSKQ